MYREHLEMPSSECWCNPILYYIAPNGNEVWVHRDPDGTEPPPDLLVEACDDADMDTWRDTAQAG
jgi:hypothetical protein